MQNFSCLKIISLIVYLDYANIVLKNYFLRQFTLTSACNVCHYFILNKFRGRKSCRLLAKEQV